MKKKSRNSYSDQIVLQLSNKQALLVMNGAREAQNNPDANFTYRHMDCIRRREAFLLHSGAKMYALGGGWYCISGYGYSVGNKMPERFKVHTLRVDEADSLRTLGFATYSLQ